jgi:hypothetical protein
MVERQREILGFRNELNDQRVQLERFTIKIGAKMNVDEFEGKVAGKADSDFVDSLQNRVDFLELQYKQTMVVLNESLGLH